MAVPKPRVLLSPAIRKDQLLEAAVWVFARKGYRGASIGHIIERAGVARGTFYLYFDGKEQIFLAIVEAFHDRITAALAAADGLADIGTDARALLVSDSAQWLNLLAAHRDATRVVLREAAAIDPRFDRGFAQLRRSAVAVLARRARHLQDLGLLRTTIVPETLAHMQLGMLDQVLHAFVLDDPTPDIPALADQLVDVLWNGIRPE